MRRLLCSLLLLVMTTSSCAKLFPPLPDRPQPPAPVPGPVDPVDPDSGIPDPYGVRKKAKDACATIAPADIRALYGLLSASANFVLVRGDAIGTTHDLGRHMDTALVNSGWTKGKYPTWSTTVSEAWKAYKVGTGPGAKSLGDPVAISECRTQLVEVLRLLSLGCKDALKEKTVVH